MAGTGDHDARAAGAVVTLQHPVAGIGRYVEEVSGRLRDLPRAERDSIETDLAQHVRDAGCATYSQCIEQLGPPDAYADGLRDGLGLGPYPGPLQRRRGSLVAAALVVVLLVAAVVGWRATRDDPLGADFQPIHGPMMSVVEGTASDAFGNGIQLVVDGGGDARFGMVLRNVSDRTLDVASLGPSSTEWRPDGSVILGGSEPFGERAPGAVVLSDIWAPEVRIARLDDPQTISIDAHVATGAVHRRPGVARRDASGDRRRLQRRRPPLRTEPRHDRPRHGSVRLNRAVSGPPRHRRR